MRKMVNIRQKIHKLQMFYHRERRMPSYSEMIKLLKYRSKNGVHKFVKKLEAHDYIRRTKNNKLVFTPKLTSSLKVLGMVQAGFPTPAEEELVDVISLDEYLVKHPEATYMLTVSGDSMIDAGIHPDDVILVERGKKPKPGDIVVAQVDEEWTLKYFGKDKKGIYLDPANKNYSRIRPERSLTLGGIVTAVIRKYGN